MLYLKNKETIRTDFLVVIAMVLIFIPIILFFKVNFLTSTILFFAVPAFYLILRKPKQLKRLVAALLAGMMVSFILDLLAEFNNAWSWAPIGQLVFPNKILGLIPIDVLIWYFFWILLSIVYYEHFFETKVFELEKISSKFKNAFIFFFLALVVIITLFIFTPEILKFRYIYLYIGIFGAIPLYYLIYKKPRLAGKLFKAGLFNIFLFLSFELTALTLDQWRFPGNYIGQIQLFGLIFPFEEFIFWIILGTPMILSYYEIFVDDEK